MRDPRPREIKWFFFSKIMWLISGRAKSRLQKKWERPPGPYSLVGEGRQTSSKELANNRREHITRAKPRIIKTEFRGGRKRYWLASLGQISRRKQSLSGMRKGKKGSCLAKISREGIIGREIAWAKAISKDRNKRRLHRNSVEPSGRKGPVSAYQYLMEAKDLGLNPEVSRGYWKFLKRQSMKVPFELCTQNVVCKPSISAVPHMGAFLEKPNFGPILDLLNWNYILVF